MSRPQALSAGEPWSRSCKSSSSYRPSWEGPRQARRRARKTLENLEKNRLRRVSWQLLGGHLREGWRCPVLLGEHGGRINGPLYADLRVVPEHGGLGLCVVLRRALVGEERRIAGDEKAVGEALGDVESVVSGTVPASSWGSY
jgi:hypothetical protein